MYVSELAFCERFHQLGSRRRNISRLIKNCIRRSTWCVGSLFSYHLRNHTRQNNWSTLYFGPYFLFSSFFVCSTTCLHGRNYQILQWRSIGSKSFHSRRTSTISKNSWDPCEHQLEGFGQWEFIGPLEGVLNNKAREVHTVFMEKWDFENEDNANYDSAEKAKRRRQI